MTPATAEAPAMTRLGQKARLHVAQELTQTLTGAKAVFVCGWQKVPVPEIESLRRSLKAASGDLTVVKNSIGRKALTQVGLTSLEPLLAGTSAVSVTQADPVVLSKILVTFAKDHEGFKVHGVVVEGQSLPLAQIKLLAALPSREVLLARMLGGMQAPITGFVGVLSGVIRQVVYVMDAVRQSKSKQEGKQS